MLVWNAREQGRRAGMKEGMQRGRDVGYREGRQVRRQDTYASMSPRRRETLTTDYATTDGEGYYDYDEESDFESPRTVTRNIPVPPPVLVPPPSNGDIHPTTIRTAPTTPHHPPVIIPPDNYIPQTGRDSVIRLPPPHELQRPPPTPQRTPSPPLPPSGPPIVTLPSRFTQTPRSFATPEPVIVNMASNRPRPRRRQSSPKSDSTTMSRFEMLNDPPPMPRDRRSPLSDIAEVLSVNMSPYPDGGTLTRGASIVS